MDLASFIDSLKPTPSVSHYCHHFRSSGCPPLSCPPSSAPVLFFSYCFPLPALPPPSHTHTLQPQRCFPKIKLKSSPCLFPKIELLKLVMCLQKIPWQHIPPRETQVRSSIESYLEKAPWNHFSLETRAKLLFPFLKGGCTFC